MFVTYVAEWWINYGESAPHLRKLAIRILSQTTSSSSCERNWSSFALVHTKQRNRMKQKKVERNVFIHYNVRLRLKNMKRARNQGQQPDYCPINLDYIFEEDDPLVLWLNNREQEIETLNSEEDNSQHPNITTRRTSQQSVQETTIEVAEESSSATPTDHGDSSDDDDDDDDDGGGGGGGGGGGYEFGSGAEDINDTVVPSTYPYASQSQLTSSSRDRGKNPLIEEEEEEKDDEEDEEEQQQIPTMDLSTINAQHTFFPHYPSTSAGLDSFAHFYGYPSYYANQLGYPINNSNDNDEDEPARNSFWM